MLDELVKECHLCFIPWFILILMYLLFVPAAGCLHGFSLLCVGLVDLIMNFANLTMLLVT